VRALAHEPFADSEPSRARLDEEQPQFGDSLALRVLHEENAAHVLPVPFGDPASLALDEGHAVRVDTPAPRANAECRVFSR
jgi:hypothetical protein